MRITSLRRGSVIVDFELDCAFVLASVDLDLTAAFNVVARRVATALQDPASPLRRATGDTDLERSRTSARWRRRGIFGPRLQSFRQDLHSLCGGETAATATSVRVLRRCCNGRLRPPCVQVEPL